MVFFLLCLEILFAESVHLHELDLVGVGERGINAFADDEFAGVGLNLHALLVEKEIDERFGRGRAWRFGAEVDVLTVAEHIVVANVVEVGALFIVGEHEAREGDADGKLAATYFVRGGTIDSAKIGLAAARSWMNFSARGFGMILSKLREPLGGQRVVHRMGHDEFAAILRLHDIFEGLGRFGRP